MLQEQNKFDLLLVFLLLIAFTQKRSSACFYSYFENSHRSKKYCKTFSVYRVPKSNCVLTSWKNGLTLLIHLEMATVYLIKQIDEHVLKSCLSLYLLSWLLIKSSHESDKGVMSRCDVVSVRSYARMSQDCVTQTANFKIVVLWLFPYCLEQTKNFFRYLKTTDLSFSCFYDVLFLGIVGKIFALSNDANASCTKSLKLLPCMRRPTRRWHT